MSQIPRKIVNFVEYSLEWVTHKEKSLRIEFALVSIPHAAQHLLASLEAWERDVDSQ